MEKAVTLSLEEYNELLQDQKDKQRLIEEREKEASEKGYLVVKNLIVSSEDTARYARLLYYNGGNNIEIYTKDEVVELANREVKAAIESFHDIRKKCDKLEKECKALKKRNLLQRIFNIIPSEAPEQKQ